MDKELAQTLLEMQRDMYERGAIDTLKTLVMSLQSMIDDKTWLSWDKFSQNAIKEALERDKS